MARARLVDVPALAWVLGYAVSRDALGRRGGAIIAAAAWPLWAGILAALVSARAGLWHQDRVVMALVTAPSARPRPPVTAVVVPVLIGLLAGIAGPGTRWLALGVAVSAAAALVSVLAPQPGRLRAGPLVPEPAIHVQMVAAASGAPRGALIDIARLVRDQHVREGIAVEVVARDEVRARVYRRWGLHPVNPGFGRMRTTASGEP